MRSYVFPTLRGFLVEFLDMFKTWLPASERNKNNIFPTTVFEESR